MTQQNNSNCPSCSESLTKNYCPNCGERKLVPKLRSIKYIVGDIIEDFITVDSKLWRTLGLLFFKPGQLDHNYHLGKRKNYLKPVALFFIINVIFVMFSPISDFYISLNDQLNLQSYSSIIKQALENYIANQGMTFEVFEIKYNQIVKVLSRTLIILQVPVFMLFVGIVFFRRKRFLSDHFIFALNAHSWLLSWVLILSILIGAIGFVLKGFNVDVILGKAYFLILQTGFIIYLLLASKKMYQRGWIGTFISTVLLVVVFLISHMVFRFLQFIITVLVV